jgi:hypothetical protein
LRTRIDRLDEGPRRLLELVAVAGAPLVQETAALAAKIEFNELVREASLLRAQNLVRTGGVRRTDAVEPYHDRVREAVLLNLDPASQRAWHGRLARALEAAEHADAEASPCTGAAQGKPKSGPTPGRRRDAASAFARSRGALYQLASSSRLWTEQRAREARRRPPTPVAALGRRRVPRRRSSDRSARSRCKAAEQPRPAIDEAMAALRTVPPRSG